MKSRSARLLAIVGMVVAMFFTGVEAGAQPMMSLISATQADGRARSFKPEELRT